MLSYTYNSQIWKTIIINDSNLILAKVNLIKSQCLWLMKQGWLYDLMNLVTYYLYWTVFLPMSWFVECYMMCCCSSGLSSYIYQSCDVHWVSVLILVYKNMLTWGSLMHCYSVRLLFLYMCTAFYVAHVITYYKLYWRNYVIYIIN